MPSVYHHNFLTGAFVNQSNDLDSTIALIHLLGYGLEVGA